MQDSYGEKYKTLLKGIKDLNKWRNTSCSWIRKWKWKLLSHAWLFTTPWTWNSPGQNTGVGSLSLLQGIFPTQGLNPGLPHCRLILYQLSHKGSPRILEWGAYPFSGRSYQPRNQTRVSCIAGRFFTHWAMREAFVSSVCVSAELWASLYEKKGYILYFFLLY